MFRRSPLTVWRFTLVELWRLMLLTAAILVVVLAFAAAVRFLADGRLGPLDTLRLMGLAVPPMLQYALPFAAGFGATLAYHRMHSDNELMACYAGGVGHRSMLAPALMSGVVLAGIVLGLSNYVIPRFLREMEALVTRDAARFIFDAIDRKEAVVMDDVLVYADLVRPVPDTSGGRYQQLYLRGVFVVQLDRDKNVIFEGSARDARVWLWPTTGAELPAESGAGWFAPTPGDVNSPARSQSSVGASGAVTAVLMQPRGMVGHKHGEMTAEQDTARMVRAIPNAFQDDPKFLTFSELAALRSVPERMGAVESRRKVLAARLGERATTDRLRSALRSRGMAVFADEQGERFVLRGADIALGANAVWGIIPAEGQSVMVDRASEGGRTVRQAAKVATFRTFVTPEAASKPVSIHLMLAQVSSVAIPAGNGKAGGIGAGPPSPGDRGAEASKRNQSFSDLFLLDDPVEPLTQAPSADLLGAADARIGATPGGDSYLQTAAEELRYRIADLMREVTSKEQERLADAAACLVMVLTGAVLAMRLKGALPLTVYMWSFFPALGAVISISAGQHVVHKHGMVGLPVLWGGVGALAVLTLGQLRKVSRH